MAKVKCSELVQCMDCQCSKLMQRANDPIIAECSVNGERDVARSKRHCINYIHTNDKKIINPIK